MVHKKIAILLLIFFVVNLTGCSFINKNPENDNKSDDSILSHNHTYDGIWKYDENGHWQSATCEHINEKGYFQAHDYNQVSVDDDYIIYECSICKYIKKETRELLIDFKEGTNDCYSINENTIIFSGIKEDSVYSISGQFLGNIVIEISDDLEFELEFNNFLLYSSKSNPITITSGDKVTLSAKKDSTNYIYDKREVIKDEEYKASIYSNSDLVISGEGMLYVVSDNFNGIHTKKDLKIKNLTLNVNCEDNALKGNDSVSVDSGNITLIAKTGDGIKTKNSDISKKGKQRGSVIIKECDLTIYAACDGIDAAYNVEIDDASTNLTIYTDKYSEYSKEVTDVSSKQYYIRSSNKNYKYSVKYYNSDDDYIWENATYYKSVEANRGGKNYYYSFPIHSDYKKIKIFTYTSSQIQSQDTNYQNCTDYLTWNTTYDTIILSSKGYSWTNYTTTISPGFGGIGGHGGFGNVMQDGNLDKGDHSTKGIKASNEIIINDGTVTIKSYDDSIHANNDTELENGETPKGNIIISGGILCVYSNDDGIHADDTVNILGGKITVANSYEGIEGSSVNIRDGDISIISLDDGINGTATSGVAIDISGGMIYVYAGGDGLDSNSKTSYKGIVFSGGKTIIISTSGGNSSIDTERGYTYSGGSVLAIMPANGMTNETTNCNNFSSIATKINKSLSKGQSVVVNDDSKVIISVEIQCPLQAVILYLGSNEAVISVS